MKQCWVTGFYSSSSSSLSLLTNSECLPIGELQVPTCCSLSSSILTVSTLHINKLTLSSVIPSLPHCSLPVHNFPFLLLSVPQLSDNQINANVPVSGMEINVKRAERNVMFTSSSQWGWCVTADSEAWLGFGCGVLKPWWRRPDVLCSLGAGKRAGTSPTLKKKKKLHKDEFLSKTILRRTKEFCLLWR